MSIQLTNLDGARLELSEETIAEIREIFDRERAFGRDLDPLRQVKRGYDPGDRFRLNANIPPAT